MGILLKGGRVVSSGGVVEMDVRIEGEKIIEVGENLHLGNDNVINVDGKLLFPGFIDGHTHFDLHVAGTVTADDFYTGTRAALAGGTTTIVDFATQYPGETLTEGLENWHKKADGKCSCDYGFHMSVTEWNPEISRELERMMDEGVTSFKLYMTYDTQVDDKTIYEILKRLKEIGGIAGVHCENSGVIAALQEEAVAAGKMGVFSHPLTRPAEAEAEAVQRLLRLAQIANAPVLVVHLTCEEGLKEILTARERGQQVFAETCPQYLLMNKELYELPGFEGAKYVIAPPLRRKEDADVLWNAVKEGQIQIISTDHCSFTTKQKELGQEDFRKIPGGMPGVETRGILMYSEGVKKGRITESEMCRLLSENPAKLFGMYPKKGVIAEGSDADIVVIDPEASGVIRAEEQLQNVDYAPFEGLNVQGKIAQVYLRGEKVMENGKVLKELTGQYVVRGKYSLQGNVG